MRYFKNIFKKLDLNFSFYLYDKSKMGFKKIPLYLFLVPFVIALILVTTLTTTTRSREIVKIYVNSDFNDPFMDSSEYRDSLYEKYIYDFNRFLDSNKKESPFIGQGEIFAKAAFAYYDTNWILLPVELALAQCQIESAFGTTGRSKVNNPFNVNEWDSKTVKIYHSTYEGVCDYYKFMTVKYLGCGRRIEDLFVNFVNCNGNRYASSDGYEVAVRNQYYYNKKWLMDN